MSSCFLVDSPRDELDSIYERYQQVAKLSKFAGGIGISWSRVRGRGALIRGTNGQSNGIVPFLSTLDAGVAAVNQGGRRKGAACVYLEPWHPDMEEFLELRDNTGEESRRTHNLNLANWIPDEFMRRVEADARGRSSTRGSPRAPRPLRGRVRHRLPRDRGEGRFVKYVKARDLYGRMMRTLAQTGNGWMTFKDATNRTCQPDRGARERRPPVEPVHRDHRGERRRRDRRLQPRLGQPRRRTSPPAGVDWERAARDGPHRRPVPRPGDRRELLPERAGGGVEPALAAGRARPDGAAGRALRPAAAVRLPPRRSSCRPGSQEEVC